MLTANNFSKIMFASAFINNSSETLFLHAPDDQLVQTIDTPNCTDKGIAFTQVNGVWTQETQDSQTTPAQAAATSSKNSSPQPSPSASAVNNQLATSNIPASNPSVLGIQKRVTAQKPKLDIPEGIVATFREPLQLLKEQQKEMPTQGIFSMVLGGSLISLSTGYKLVRIMRIL
jgi:hypothetical protein